MVEQPETAEKIYQWNLVESQGGKVEAEEVEDASARNLIVRMGEGTRIF